MTIAAVGAAAMAAIVLGITGPEFSPVQTGATTATAATGTGVAGATTQQAPAQPGTRTGPDDGQGADGPVAGRQGGRGGRLPAGRPGGGR
ncbi:hypothetical protein ACF1AJ_11015 [Leifsonia sp. NPDC014704]|uniref:hypothetical protein n=1 Tax=Leifsonia sp. NPDC014704 TaxID=3364123 RepID=UPI0036F4A407